MTTHHAKETDNTPTPEPATPSVCRLHGAPIVQDAFCHVCLSMDGNALAIWKRVLALEDKVDADQAHAKAAKGKKHA